MTPKPPDRYVVTPYGGEGAPKPPNHEFVIQRQTWRWWGMGNRWMPNVADRMVGGRRYKKDEIDDALAARDRLNAESEATT